MVRYFSERYKVLTLNQAQCEGLFKIKRKNRVNSFKHSSRIFEAIYTNLFSNQNLLHAILFYTKAAFISAELGLPHCINGQFSTSRIGFCKWI